MVVNNRPQGKRHISVVQSDRIEFFHFRSVYVFVDRWPTRQRSTNMEIVQNRGKFDAMALKIDAISLELGRVM